MIYIFGRTVTQGKRIGLASAMGVCAGAFVHATAAAIGLSAILVSSSALFTAVKLAGAAYLIYLGLIALKSKESILSTDTDGLSGADAVSSFRQGLLTNILNPKVAIFFMAFLPQFMSAGGFHPTLQLIILGSTAVAVAVVFEILFVMMADGLARKILRNSKVVLWINRVFGAVLVSIGLRLALTANRVH